MYEKCLFINSKDFRHKNFVWILSYSTEEHLDIQKLLELPRLKFVKLILQNDMYEICKIISDNNQM